LAICPRNLEGGVPAVSGRQQTEGRRPCNYGASGGITMAEIEVWIAMNEAGDYEIGCDEDSAIPMLG
jgi:hypothetical protein